MKTLKFYGYSDDTFGEYGVTGQECNNGANGEPIQCIVDCGEYGRVLVVGQRSNVTMDFNCYCWMIGIAKVDEEDEMPDWRFRYAQSDCENSPALLMDVPEEGCGLEWFIGGRKVEQ